MWGASRIGGNFVSKKMSAEAQKDWEEKMSQPMKPRKLTPEEIEKLKKEGRI